jgi:nucleoside 2-deoxyribosyltransferase
MSEPVLKYDKAARKGVIEFPNGHRLTIGNVDEEQAQAFFKKNAAEFQKRDCVLHTVAGFETREHGND